MYIYIYINGISIIFPDSTCYNVVNRQKNHPHLELILLGLLSITRFEPIQEERTNLHCGKRLQFAIEHGH